MPVYTWSPTAASNATADPTINWAEGQAPSSVNDSARSAMSATAKWRDDISGSITTGGTATAYTLATNSVFDTLAHMAGQLIAFIPHATNTSDTQTTLAVDGLAAKPIRFAPGVEIQARCLVLGAPYLVSYNNADGAFYLIGRENDPISAGKFQVDLGGVNQAVAASSAVKIQFTNKPIDPDGLFDNATNFRYTPTKPGYYYFVLQTTVDGVNSAAQLYKNGSVIAVGSGNTSSATGFTTSNVQYLVKTTNGTDFFEGFVQTGTGSTVAVGSAVSTFMMGWRISP